jgi:iron(III) transport system ATP-binding protein
VADGIALPMNGNAPGPACISIRPQDISVGTPEGNIPARIAEREFLGNITRYHTQAGAQSIVVDVPHRRGMKALDVGETIGLIIPPSQVSVLR